MSVSKKEWAELEKLKKENARLDKEIEATKRRIEKKLKKNPHEYDGLRDDEH